MTGYPARVALFFTAIFLVAGTKLPYLPVWLDFRGLSGAEIAIITAAPLFLRIVATPAIAMLADRWGNHRGMVVLLAWCSLACLLTLSMMTGFWPILAVTLVLAIVTTSIMPLTETIAMTGVRQAGADYGRMRLWGSLSFIAASFLSGVLVTRHGAGIVAGVLIAGGLATVVAAHLLPRPVALSDGRTGVAIGDIVAMLRNPRFVGFLAAVGLIQSAHAVFYTFGVLHWRAQGLSESWAGVLWAIGVIAEIGLFAFSGAVMRRMGALGLILAGGLASVVRWVAMGFDPAGGTGLPAGPAWPHLWRDASRCRAFHEPPCAAGTGRHGASTLRQCHGRHRDGARHAAGGTPLSDGGCDGLSGDERFRGWRRHPGAADRPLSAAGGLIAESPRDRAAAAA